MIRDPWSWAYGLIAIAALALTSVATFIFFGYLLAPELALAATVVLAAGIPVLKWAVRFERRPGRARWLWAALVGFLGIELLAQYFKGQAAFARTVAGRGDLAGSDLAAAAADPFWSRVLAILFLASLPFVVVLMVDRLADRAVTLRAHQVARGLRRFARLRARFARLRGALAPLRAGLAAAHAELAALRAQLARAHEERDHARGLAVQLRAELDRERARPVLSVETAAQLLIQAGAPEATIRGWQQAGRLQLADARETIEEV